MLAKELIELLSKNPNATVLVELSTGFKEIKKVNSAKVCAQENDGKHWKSEFDYAEADEISTQAFVLNY